MTPRAITSWCHMTSKHHKMSWYIYMFFQRMPLKITAAVSAQALQLLPEHTHTHSNGWNNVKKLAKPTMSVHILQSKPEWRSNWNTCILYGTFFGLAPGMGHFPISTCYATGSNTVITRQNWQRTLSESLESHWQSRAPLSINCRSQWPML